MCGGHRTMVILWRRRQPRATELPHHRSMPWRRRARGTPMPMHTDDPDKLPRTAVGGRDDPVDAHLEESEPSIPPFEPGRDLPTRTNVFWTRWSGERLSDPHPLVRRLPGHDEIGVRHMSTPGHDETEVERSSLPTLPGPTGPQSQVSSSEDSSSTRRVRPGLHTSDRVREGRALTPRCAMWRRRSRRAR